MTNAFLHDISMSMHKDDSIRKTKGRHGHKKKFKHQSLSKSLLFFQPNSKYFKKKDDTQVMNRHYIQKLSCQLAENKKIMKVDNGFVMFDFLNKMEIAFDNFLLEPLTKKNLMIGEAEKRVKFTRNLVILK